VLSEVIVKPRHPHVDRAIADESGTPVSASDVIVQDWVTLVRAEYLEMPGLSLTEVQAGRLWNLSVDIAEALLEELQRARFLRRTTRGTYVRADLCRP
jgi:hypothetical protein